MNWKFARLLSTVLCTGGILSQRHFELLFMRRWWGFEKKNLLCVKQSTNVANISLADHSSLNAVLKPEQQRSSVIVNPIQFSSQTQDIVNPPEFPQLTNQANEVVKFNTQQRKEEGKSKDEVDEMEELTLPAMENIDMVDLKDIQTICMSFLAEAPPFMQEKRELFYNAWYQVGTNKTMNIQLLLMLKVNMGEECMGHFINYVKKRSSLPLSFFVMSGKQYR